MKAWQRTCLKIARAVRGILSDLFGEGDAGETNATRPVSRPAESIQLGLIQAQLDALAPELTRLENRRLLAEAECARLAADLAALDSAVDQALLRGDDEQARQLAWRRLELARQHQDLAQRCQEHARIAADAHAVVQRMDRRYTEIRRRQAGLAAYEQDAAALEHIAAVRREMEDALVNLEATRQNNERGDSR